MYFLQKHQKILKSYDNVNWCTKNRMHASGKLSHLLLFVLYFKKLKLCRVWYQCMVILSIMTTVTSKLCARAII